MERVRAYSVNGKKVYSKTAHGLLQKLQKVAPNAEVFEYGRHFYRWVKSSHHDIPNFQGLHP